MCSNLQRSIVHYLISKCICVVAKFQTGVRTTLLHFIMTTSKHCCRLLRRLTPLAETNVPYENKRRSVKWVWVGNVECGNGQRVTRTTDRQLCGRGWAGGLQAYNFYYNKGVADVRYRWGYVELRFAPFFFNEYAKRRRLRRQRLPVCDFISDTPRKTKESLHATAAAAAAVAKQLQSLTARVCGSL